MSILLRNFRRWWQPPRNFAERHAHRQVTFLELFYDLVYVVLIAQLTHALAAKIDARHIAEFAFMFIIAWWAWLNGATYHDFHGNNDIRTRVFTFLQMFTVAAMALFAHDALIETSVGFALSYAAFQIILTYLWWRTGVYDPAHRPISRFYAGVFLLCASLFAASVFVEPPQRFHLWGIATLISILLPPLILTLRRRIPAAELQVEASATPTASLVERFGLFTIIVLGEVIVGVVQGLASHHGLSLRVGAIAALGLAIAFVAWWLYFDFVSHRFPRSGNTSLLVWTYAHLPVTAGIAIVGAALLNVVEQAGEALLVEVRWLLVCAIGIVLVGIAVMLHTLEPDEELAQSRRMGKIVMVLAAVAIVALGSFSLEAIPMLGIIVALMLAPVSTALVSWIKQVETKTAQ